MRKEQDEISKLLDSLNEEDELDEKMDAFAKRKQKTSVQKEVDLTQVDILSVNNKPKDEPIVLGIDDKIGATRTMDWNQEKTVEPQPNGGTVVINDQEIKSLLDEEKGPKLRREVVRKKGEPSSQNEEVHTKLKKEVKQDTSNKKTVVTIVVALLGAMLAGALIFGVVKVVGDATKNDSETTELQDKYYKEIMAWAEDYSTYSDDEKEKILDYETKFNKLSKDQKADIDDVLIAQTGKSFDELLAKAKSSSEDKKNNNTEIAEKKAELKDKISSLKSKISKAEEDVASAQSDLDDANKELETAQKKLDDANAQISQAQTEYDNAKVLYQQADSRRNELYNKQQTEEGLNEEEQSELGELYNNYATLQNNLKKTESNLNDLKSKLNVTGIQTEVDQAQTKVNDAQTALTEAQSVVDSYNQELGRLQKDYNALNDED